MTMPLHPGEKSAMIFPGGQAMPAIADLLQSSRLPDRDLPDDDPN
jgi:hypothetical protein